MNSNQKSKSSLSNVQINKVHLLLDKVSQQQRDDFGTITSDLKPDGTLITACDRWSDETIVKGLSKIASSLINLRIDLTSFFLASLIINPII